jgi:GNAT superfamily N-acetyltransferase
VLLTRKRVEDTMDENLERIPVIMTIDPLPDHFNHPIPNGFALRRFRAGEQEKWADIERAAGEFSNRQKALNHFGKEFGPHLDDFCHRCFFLTGPGDKPIGTATAWYSDDFLGSEWGRLHWVAIIPEYQGGGLAKPLVAGVLRKMSALQRRAYLTTQTSSYKAVKVYHDMGFFPFIQNKIEIRGWKILSDKLGIVFDKMTGNYLGE